MIKIDVKINEEIFLLFKLIEKLDEQFTIGSSQIKVRNLTEALNILANNRDMRLVCRLDCDNKHDQSSLDEFLVIDEPYEIESDIQAESFQQLSDRLIDNIFTDVIVDDPKLSSYLLCPKQDLESEWLNNLVTTYNYAYRLYNNLPLFIREQLINSVLLVPDNHYQSLLYKGYTPINKIDKTGFIRQLKQRDLSVACLNQLL